jgi:hypothetical protein
MTSRIYRTPNPPSLIKRHITMITIKLKSNSALMKFFAFFLGKTFLTDYCPTIGTTLYIPSREWANSHIPVLAHELVHVWQKSKHFFYHLMYLSFWRSQFEAQAYCVQVWYANSHYGADKTAEWKRLTDKYFVPFGIYLFLSGKKPTYVEPGDELKLFVLQSLAVLTSPGGSL